MDKVKTWATRPIWSLMDWAALAMTLAFVLWFLVPSSVFVKPVSLRVNGMEVTFVRETPFGSVRGAWVSEITTVNGFECNSEQWREAYYQKQPGDTVWYTLGPWAAPCIRGGADYILRTTRRIWLFDLIPLRANQTITEVTR